MQNKQIAHLKLTAEMVDGTVRHVISTSGSPYQICNLIEKLLKSFPQSMARHTSIGAENYEAIMMDIFGRVVATYQMPKKMAEEDEELQNMLADLAKGVGKNER